MSDHRFISPRDRRRQASCCALAALLACLSGCGLVTHGQNAEGVRLYQQGSFPQAIERFQKAIASDPQNADGYYNLAATYHLIGRQTKNDQDLKQAEDLYNQCLDRDTDETHRECYRGLAVLLAEEGRTDEAFRLLEGWSNKKPSAAAPKVELARLSEEYGKYKDAEDYLQEALTVDPRDPRAWAALGRLRERSGDPNQALANYQRSLEFNGFQPGVAAKVASLRTDLNPTPLTTSGGTRMVNGNPAGGRY